MTSPHVNLTMVELEIVTSILSHLIPEREVRAFGSRVNGKSKSFSDLDLAIMGKEPLSPATMADLRDAFTESDLPFKVDLTDWANTSDIFRTIIDSSSVAIP